MKRVLSLVVIILSVLAFTSIGYAQDDVKTKFYNFDDMLIDGEFKKPTGMHTSAREEARFKHLLKLKKSFLEKIEETSKVDALK